MGGIPVSWYLDTIEVLTIKRNVSCELIDFTNYMRYGKDLSFRVRFYNNSLHSGYYITNQQILFEIFLQNFTAVYNRLYTTNITGEFEIFIPNITNFSKGVNYLRFTVLNNQFFESNIFKYELYFEIMPMQNTDLKKDKANDKGATEINHITIFSLSMVVSVLCAILILMRYKNIKKKPKNLYDISFRY